MALTYPQIKDLYESDALKDQILVAIGKFAVYTLETIPTPANTAEERQVAWAKLAVAEPYEMAQLMRFSVVSNGTIQANHENSDPQPDSLIQSTVETVAPGYYPPAP